MDVVAACAGLFVLSPLLVVVAVAIKLDSPGPVFYRSSRIGQHGRPFGMLKFRSMVADAERRGGSSTPDDDPRVTRAGRWLRKYELDEIPQLFNVLIGDMSLVGPRPQVPWAVEMYSTVERGVLTVRPGMTDYASLAFIDEGRILHGSRDPDRDYFERVHSRKMRLGLKYVEEMSFGTDVRILAATLGRLFRKRDADGEASEL